MEQNSAWTIWYSLKEMVEEMDGSAKKVKLVRQKWDSDFFGFPVWTLRADHADFSVVEVLGCLQDFQRFQPGGTCYVFLSKEIHGALCSELTRMGAVHFGSRVEFCADVDALRCDTVYDVMPINEITDEVRNLAVGSGMQSRFARDVRFSKMCRSMYIRWIENCFTAADNGDGEVLGVYDKGVLAGLMAVTVTGGVYKIELLSVSAAYRRQGIGKRLVRCAFSHACAKKCHKIVVVTQGENLAGCSLYQACGFKECKRSEIWHLTI